MFEICLARRAVTAKLREVLDLGEDWLVVDAKMAKRWELLDSSSTMAKALSRGLELLGEIESNFGLAEKKLFAKAQRWHQAPQSACSMLQHVLALLQNCINLTLV